MFPGRRQRRREIEDEPSLDRALSELIEAHSDACYRLALGVVRDRSLAEDVVQDAMIKAWRSLPNFRGDSSKRTWILRITHNTAIDALRRRREQSTAPHDLPDDGSGAGEDPAARAAGRADLVALGRALAELDELSRSVVVLREVEGLSYAEIAQTLELPIATVKTRLLRARRSLERAVSDQEVT